MEAYLWLTGTSRSCRQIPAKKSLCIELWYSQPLFWNSKDKGVILWEVEKIWREWSAEGSLIILFSFWGRIHMAIKVIWRISYLNMILFGFNPASWLNHSSLNILKCELPSDLFWLCFWRENLTPYTLRKKMVQSTFFGASGCHK